MWLKLLVLNPALTATAVLLFYYGLIAQLVLLTSNYGVSDPVQADGEFCSIKNLVERSAHFSQMSVSLVTQASLDHANHLRQLADRWQGPISVAFYIDDWRLLGSTLTALSHLHSCHENINAKVSIHILYPAVFGICPIAKLHHKPSKASSCDNAEPNFPKIEKSSKNRYPVNAARNLAKQLVETEYEMVADIELIPNAGFAQKVLKFLSRSPLGRKDVLVVPVFETDQNLNYLPDNVTVLSDLTEKRLVVPFHTYRAYECHRIPEIERWYGISDGRVRTLHSTKWIRPCWEPVYIARANSAPLYDQRFRGYGKNKIQQVYEMCRADFKFHIITDVFLVHKNISKITNEEWLRIQETVMHNNALFEKFQRELDEKYTDRDIAQYCDGKTSLMRR